MMRALIKSIAVSAWLCSIGSAAVAQTTVAGATLFQNVRIYDGTGKFLSAPSNVLVRGNRIERISRAPIPVDPAVGGRSCGGATRTGRAARVPVGACRRRRSSRRRDRRRR